MSVRHKRKQQQAGQDTAQLAYRTQDVLGGRLHVPRVRPSVPVALYLEMELLWSFVPAQPEAHLAPLSIKFTDIILSGCVPTSH